MSIIKPIVDTCINEAGPLKFFMLGSLITSYIYWQLNARYKRPKCYVIEGFKPTTPRPTSR